MKTLLAFIAVLFGLQAVAQPIIQTTPYTLGLLTNRTAASARTYLGVSGGGSGTVTSVGLSVPSFLSVSGTPVTTSGTLAVTLGTQVKNLFFAGPVSGADAAPTFRIVTLASADYVNQGTTTTVLHGNAAGNPTWGAIALGTDVSGTLAAAQFPALTGDITTSAGSLATTLATVASAGTSTKVTYNVKGLVTSGTAAALASSDFANQGTTTTLLHGNASGNPSFAQVSIATDVSSATSANLASVISDETGTGSLVFNKEPTLMGQVLLSATNNIMYNVAIPSLGAGNTNLVVDFSMSDQYLSTTTNMFLMQTTNRPAATTNSLGTVFVISADGGNVIVRWTVGWKVANNSATTGLTITNGDRGVFSFKTWGPAETNASFAYTYLH